MIENNSGDGGGKTVSMKRVLAVTLGILALVILLVVGVQVAATVGDIDIGIRNPYALEDARDEISVMMREADSPATWEQSEWQARWRAAWEVVERNQPDMMSAAFVCKVFYLDGIEGLERCTQSLNYYAETH